MSTLRNLAHFLEDDTTPQVLPMEISVRDTHVNLKVRIAAVASRDGCCFHSAIQFPFCPEAVAAVCLLAESQKDTCPSFPHRVAVISLISHCRTAEQVSRTLLKIRNPGVIALCLWTEYFMALLKRPECALLQDAGPRDASTDSEPLPITVHVDSLIIHRKDDGSFSVGGDAELEDNRNALWSICCISKVCFAAPSRHGC